MPCDQVRLAQLEIPRMDQTTLREAIDRMDGWSIVDSSSTGMTLTTPRGGVRLDFQNGTITLPQGEEDLRDDLVIAYGRQAVRSLARRYGWATQETGNRIVVRR